MITEHLDLWKVKNDMVGCEIDEDTFATFFHEVFSAKRFMDAMCDLGYAIYELEICIDGIIEDMEALDGQSNKKA
jgi:hypothetical protein